MVFGLCLENLGAFGASREEDGLSIHEVNFVRGVGRKLFFLFLTHEVSCAKFLTKLKPQKTNHFECKAVLGPVPSFPICVNS